MIQNIVLIVHMSFESVYWRVQGSSHNNVIHSVMFVGRHCYKSNGRGRLIKKSPRSVGGPVLQSVKSDSVASLTLVFMSQMKCLIINLMSYLGRLDQFSLIDVGVFFRWKQK